MSGLAIRTLPSLHETPPDTERGGEIEMKNFNTDGVSRERVTTHVAGEEPHLPILHKLQPVRLGRG